jgi:hypothetical protein
MTLWWTLRLVKWVGLLLLGGGVAGALGQSSLDARRRAVYRLATPGFFLLWLAGFGLARQTATSLGSPWISASLLSSLLMLQALAWSVERPGRERAATFLVTLPLAVTLLLMVLQPFSRPVESTLP